MKSLKKLKNGSVARKIPPKPSVKFDYLKSNTFRVLHADGIYGGITPQGLLQIAFFSERFPIPTQMVYEVTPAGKLGKEIPELRVGRDALVRELDVSVLLNGEIAKALHNWLGDHLKKLEEFHKKKIK